MTTKKKSSADYMSEEAFKEAVLPMLEQAYKQGYEDGYAQRTHDDETFPLKDAE